MSKRKRQDSPTSIMNVPPINEIERFVFLLMMI